MARQRDLIRPTFLDDGPRLSGPREAEVLELQRQRAIEREARAERRAIQEDSPNKRFPPIDSPSVTTWGWGVRLADPEGWVGPTGEIDHPWAWQRREHAETLALAWQAMQRPATVVWGHRERGCLPPAREPWDEGFNPREDVYQCGNSLRWEPVENRRASRQRTIAERAAARALKDAAAAEKIAIKEARKAARAAVPRDLAKQWAILLRGDPRDPKFWPVVAELEKRHRRPLWDRDGDSPEIFDTARDTACQDAADAARSDLPLARRIAAQLSPERCRTARQVIERVARERAELAARARQRERVASARAERLAAPKEPKAPKAPKAPKEPKAPRQRRPRATAADAP